MPRGPLAAGTGGALRWTPAMAIASGTHRAVPSSTGVAASSRVSRASDIKGDRRRALPDAGESLHMPAAMPHIEGRCRSSPQAPTSVPFASCSGKRPARNGGLESWLPPDAAPVIRGTGGIRKLRWAGSGRGKRGGIRVVFYQAGPDVIYLLTAYAKADREDLTPADSKALTRLVAAIKKELQGK